MTLLTMELPTCPSVPPGEPPGRLLPPDTLLCKPCGELPYLELIANYAEAAFAQPHASWLLCDGFPSLTALRAALLGGRQCGRPVAATVAVDAEGAMPSGGNPLCALLMAKSLGASAFGVRFPPDGLDAAAELLRQMAAHTALPLIAQPEQPLAADALRRFLSCGARVFLPEAVVPEERTRAARLIGTYGPVEPPVQDGTLLVCNETELFYLDEYFELSEPVVCGRDMADGLLAAEDAGCDAVSVSLSAPEDALAFAENQHMLRLPVAFRADSEEALELALIHYNGRSIVDSRSDAPENRLAELAAGYGALLR